MPKKKITLATTVFLIGMPVGTLLVFSMLLYLYWQLGGNLNSLPLSIVTYAIMGTIITMTGFVIIGIAGVLHMRRQGKSFYDYMNWGRTARPR